MKCWNWNGHAATPPTCESRCQKTTTHLKKKPSALRNWILLTHRSPSIVSVSALGTSEETRISSCWHPLSFIRETYIHKTWQGVLSFVKKQIRLAKKKTIESASVGWWFGSCETLLCLFIWIHFKHNFNRDGAFFMLYNVAYCSNYSPVNYHHQQQVCRSKSFLTCLYCCYTRIVSTDIHHHQGNH